MESLIQTLHKGDKQTIETKLVNLTKDNALLDVNNMILSRKY